MNPVWSDRYRINWYEADANNCASLVTLCNFLQVSAFRHAHHLGFDYTREGGFDRLWVLIRILIHMDEYPSWNEEIEIKTWHRGAEGLVAMRDFEILDAKGKRLGVVSSHWFLLDPETRRAVVPEITDTAISSVWPVAVMEDQPGRIHVPHDLPLIRTVTAGYTDRMPSSLLRPVASLPLAIYFQLNTPYPEVQQRAYAAALILTAIVLAISLGTRWLTARFSKFTIK